jgi:putative hydrolase of the HAD superfamily
MNTIIKDDNSVAIESNERTENAPMPVKAVFFDAAGTLIRPVRRVGESYAVTAAKYGKTIPSSAISARFRGCFESAPPLAFPGASPAELPALERSWWEQMVRRILDPWQTLESFEEYFSDLFGYFARPEAWSLYPEVPKTLTALETRGLSLAVVSNFDSRLLQILEGLRVARWFKHVFISSRVGHAKPAREIFEAALDRHEITANCAVHIGDSEEKDLQGAMNAGLKGVLLDRGGERVCATFSRITALNEVLDMLDNGL